MTKIYRTTGSKRISVIISDNKGKYLVVRTDNDSERSLEFPGFSEANYDFPEEQRENLINKEFTYRLTMVYLQSHPCSISFS